jgi:hypothetical protein
MIHVFLSASVPLPNRDPEFLATADVVAIREAIKALVGEVIPKGYLEPISKLLIAVDPL